jgi:hypothetical protein
LEVREESESRELESDGIKDEWGGLIGDNGKKGAKCGNTKVCRGSVRVGKLFWTK